MNKCGTCKHFIGGGDWNLCCTVRHPTPKEREWERHLFLDICVMNIQMLVICMNLKEIDYETLG